MSLSVNCVVKTGWILERCARELAERLPDVVLNETGWPPTAPSTTALTYFMPEKDIRHMPGPVPGLKVGFFTHDPARTRLYAQRFDACVAMNRAVAGRLEKLGARNVRLIRPGTEPPDRPIRFGVCGRVYGKGRKGAHLVAAAVAEGYWFQACSEPLPGKLPPCRITHDVRDRGERSRFYRDIDYLVVTSLEEGGPMPVLEAIAHGKGVIAPDVGWCWDVPEGLGLQRGALCIQYERGSWESLRGVLEALTRPPSWEAWAEQHRALFAELERGAAA